MCLGTAQLLPLVLSVFVVNVCVCARECVCLCMFNEHGTVPARAAVIAFQYAM